MFNCKICGKIEHAGYIKDTKERLIANSLCFDCDFWDGYIKRKDEPSIVRVGGCHYCIADENADKYMRGFSGRRFDVKFFDGRDVTTTNLWCQGDIPERFRGQLADNAIFA